MRSEDLAATADPLAPTTTMMLPVGDGHSLHIETVGDPDRQAAVFLHGGPGSGCQPSHRALFDPTRYHAVLFDQRGAGRSTPHRSRTANTTQHQIADMEMIRRALGIERWLVVGGSWGATLALAYAQTHPQRVSGLVLRATFLGTHEELQAAFVTRLKRLYPLLYADFLGILPEAERSDPLPAYWRRILDLDPAVRGHTPMAWHDTERILSLARPTETRLDMARLLNPPNPLPSTPFMEAHYFANGCFLAPGQLMRQAGVLAGIPGVIVQGEFDHLCPPSTSEALASAWTDAHVDLVAGGGHALSDPAIETAVKAAIAHFA